jgi:hypothetical protein
MVASFTELLTMNGKTAVIQQGKTINTVMEMGYASSTIAHTFRALAQEFETSETSRMTESIIKPFNKNRKDL